MRFWASMAFSPPEHYIALAKAAEEAGVHGISISDHIFFPEKLESPYPYSADGVPIWTADTAWPDVWVTVGAMAGATTTLEFASAIYIAPARDLFTVAKQVGTAAVLSNNRVNLGLGAGWMREEFDQTGQSYDNRGPRLNEMIKALRVLWQGGSVEHHGEFYDFGPLKIEPAPTKQVPIWCGGQTKPAMRRAATLCDGWIGNAYSEEVADIRVTEIKRHLEEAGRAGEPFDIVLGLYSPLTPEVVERWAAKGVTGLMCVPWFGADRSDDKDVASVQSGTGLSAKIEATIRFGEEIIKPSAGL